MFTSIMYKTTILEAYVNYLKYTVLMNNKTSLLYKNLNTGTLNLGYFVHPGATLAQA